MKEVANEISEDNLASETYNAYVESINSQKTKK